MGYALLLLALLCSTSAVKTGNGKWTHPYPSSSELKLKLNVSEGNQRLDSVLSFYEKVSLDPVDESSLQDAGSAASEEDHLPAHLIIAALNRTFALHLRRGDTVFTPDAKIVVHGRDAAEDTEMDASELSTNYVEGFLLDEPKSSVRGHVHQGAFFGAISTPLATYFVEPADAYLEGAGRLDAIVYEEGAAKSLPGAAGGSFCYAARNQWLRRSNRTTAAAATGQPARMGKACKVKVVADHFFFKAYGKSNVRRTVAEMEFHVREADRMFSVTDFNTDGEPDEVHIRLAKAEVFKSSSDAHYTLGDTRLNASAYLELFSMYEHDGLCGAMAFSQRTFPKDVLGFAYRGAPDRVGGICSRRMNVEGKMRSLNVGMTSFDFRGATIPKARSTVVFAHELGHMFGAPHDEESDGGACFLQDDAKHYIMSAIANPGTTNTNRLFSSCSVKLMYNNMMVHGQCLPCRGKECGAGGRVVPGALAVAACSLFAALLAVATVEM